MRRSWPSRARWSSGETKCFLECFPRPKCSPRPFAILVQRLDRGAAPPFRIDDNVEEVDQNVTGAQNELVKYLNSVTGNRMLIAKIFAVLMMFSAIWVIFFV